MKQLELFAPSRRRRVLVRRRRVTVRYHHTRMIDWRPGRITCPYIKRYLNAPERLRKRPYPLMHPGGIVGGALSDHYFRRDGLWFVGIGPRAECTAWGGRLIGCGYCAMAPPRDGATQNPEEQ